MFDMKCEACDHIWEASKAYDDQLECPKCQSKETKTLLTGFRFQRVKDPFDLVHKGMHLPPTQTIKSYGNDKRRGGKDTT
jgi:putative FmdB family regulatory protein